MNVVRGNNGSILYETHRILQTRCVGTMHIFSVKPGKTYGTTMLYRVNDMQDVCFRLHGYNLYYIPCQLSPWTGPAIYRMNVLLVSGNHLLYNIHCPQLVRRYDVKNKVPGVSIIRNKYNHKYNHSGAYLKRRLNSTSLTACKLFSRHGTKET